MNFLLLIKSESYKKGTARSVLFNIISKGILFFLTIIIARYFGSNIKTDIYFFVFAAMILFSGFINNMDTAVLIPESMRLREKEGDETAAAFLNYFLIVYFIIGILFTVAMYFFGTAVFGLISKFSKADIITYRNYFWIGSLFFIFHILTNYLNTILTSLKYFSLPMIISSFKSCIVIVCIFLLKARYDVLSVFFGGLISYAVNLILQLYVLRKIAGWSFIIKSSAITKNVRNNVFYAGLGQTVTVASSLLPLYLLSGFGSGVISVMNYGKNIADIPNTLVTAQFANVSGIKLNEQSARHDHAGMNDTFAKTSKLLVFILVPVGFYLFVFAQPMVELFYQNRNFNTEAVAASAVFLKLLALSVFCIGINALVTRIFIAVQAIKQAFIYQVIMNVLLIIAIWLFIKYIGAFGYGYAVLTINIINLAGLFFICRVIAPQINYSALVKYTGLIILLNGMIATAIYYAAGYLQTPIVFKLTVLFAVWLLILAVLNKYLHLDFNISLNLKNNKTVG